MPYTGDLQFLLDGDMIGFDLTPSGGAGGKGTWGKLTDMYEEGGHLHDSRDPNYDSAEEEVCYGCACL